MKVKDLENKQCCKWFMSLKCRLNCYVVLLFIIQQFYREMRQQKFSALDLKFVSFYSNVRRILTFKFFWINYNLSRGVLPENLRRGPYAVVERAERSKPFSPLVKIIYVPDLLLKNYVLDLLSFWILTNNFSENEPILP